MTDHAIERLLESVTPILAGRFGRDFARVYARLVADYGPDPTTCPKTWDRYAVRAQWDAAGPWQSAPTGLFQQAWRLTFHEEPTPDRVLGFGAR